MSRSVTPRGVCAGVVLGALVSLGGTGASAAQEGVGPPRAQLPVTAVADYARPDVLVPAPEALRCAPRGSVWDHLRFAIPAGANISHDPSNYFGPRSFDVLASWTTGRGTLLRFRMYADNYLPREMDGRRVNPTVTSANFQSSMKEIYVSHKFANNFAFTVGDIRATAHSDNNKRLYEGDGKPIHSDISEIDRVLGASVAKDYAWGRTEFTLADRGRKDLRWDGLMETVRVSKAAKNGLREVQGTFVNRNGDDAGGVAALHQWQYGVGGSIASTGRMDVLSVEYVHGNFFPKRGSSTDAFGIALERRLLRNGALSAVVNYEWINGPTGVDFYEAGASAIVGRLSADSFLKVDGGYRRLVPTASAQPIQHGPFVRVGIIFDHGKGATLPAAAIIR